MSASNVSHPRGQPMSLKYWLRNFPVKVTEHKQVIASL